MNNRLDDRIRAFVVELVADPVEPPPLTESTARPPSRQSRRLWPAWSVAIVAFVAVIGLGVAAVLLRRSPGPELAQDSSLASRIAAVETMIEAHNSGDFAVWRAHFVANGPNILRGPVQDESELDWQRSLMAANEVWTLDGECRPDPTHDEWITCPMTFTNDFWGPAGVILTGEVRFVVGRDGLLREMSMVTSKATGEPLEFITMFDQWLAEAHPDVHASFGQGVDGEGTMPNPDDMPRALQYVDEFIAQSDVYPIEGK